MIASAHPLLGEPGLVIAHRGDRAHAPENTMVALERAAAAGADAFEIDVRTTVDGHLVLCHDPTIDRTADGAGEVATMTLAEIHERDAGANWSPDADPERANGGVRHGPRPFASRGVRFPTLDDVLGAFPAVPMIIEAKTANAGRALVPMLERHGARDRVLVGAFGHRVLRPLRNAGFRHTASRRELVAMLPSAYVGWPERKHPPFHAIAIPPSYAGLRVPVRGYAAVAGCPVFVWTVNDADAARRYLALGVHGVITDDPGGLRDRLS